VARPASPLSPVTNAFSQRDFFQVPKDRLSDRASVVSNPRQTSTKLLSLPQIHIANFSRSPLYDHVSFLGQDGKSVSASTFPVIAAGLRSATQRRVSYAGLTKLTKGRRLALPQVSALSYMFGFDHDIQRYECHSLTAKRL
jgi:hypothetical protein